MMRLGKKKYLLMLFCLVSPFVFSWTILKWISFASHLSLFSPSWPTSTIRAISAATDLLGAFIPSIILVVPLTWWIRGQPLLITLCLSLSAFLGSFMPNFLVELWLSSFVRSQSMLIIHLFFFVTCWIVAKGADVSLSKYKQRDNGNNGVRDN